MEETLDADIRIDGKRLLSIARRMRMLALQATSDRTREVIEQMAREYESLAYESSDDISDWYGSSNIW
jgi:hypothetical protein